MCRRLLGTMFRHWTLPWAADHRGAKTLPLHTVKFTAPPFRHLQELREPTRVTVPQLSPALVIQALAPDPLPTLQNLPGVSETGPAELHIFPLLPTSLLTATTIEPFLTIKLPVNPPHPISFFLLTSWQWISVNWIFSKGVEWNGLLADWNDISDCKFDCVNAPLILYVSNSILYTFCRNLCCSSLYCTTAQISLSVNTRVVDTRYFYAIIRNR